MTEGITASATTRPVAGHDTTRRATRELLVTGLIAGPLWVGVAALQALLRPGFDLGRHALSALSVGDAGWVQIGNFVVGGLLTIAFAVGVRAALRGGRAGTWGPRLIGAFGVGLIVAGIFPPDPALGFPPGAPAGMPAAYSSSAIAHSIGFIGAFSSLVAATLVFSRRFAAIGERGWVAYSLASGLGALVLSGWPSTDGASVRYAIAAVIAWAWVTLLAVRLRGEQRA
ncbi:MAG TPA: DUF998 domain-containing protein [Candidatus Limnocylindrales bacterium]|nr:DUF998 domain-containing protein [Candidatus Limnocylindrales bacterium]